MAGKQAGANMTATYTGAFFLTTCDGRHSAVGDRGP